jgi:putative toxin-antitoxin system antitoxin component (TIGR02293 family)
MRQEATEETLRIARIVDHAIRVFGSETKAIRWLRKENGTLTNRRPIDLLKSETGAQAVEEALHRIDYGMYA